MRITAKLILSFLLICGIAASASAEDTETLPYGLETIRKTLEKSSAETIQEKVYIHTDNTCYFVGDTLWYKAYVVRADNFRPTDMSRILYVELLTPDGLLVERQHIIVSDKGFSCGNFTLKDSLYSGYYELRAYTRWMLNFNAYERRFSKNDSYYFYNKAMAKDYFRAWNGLYSRVIPIYSKPDQAGDFTYKRMYQRPHQRIRKALPEKLHASFYPEGGHLVEGVENRVAFELTNQEGAAVNAKGYIYTKDKDSERISVMPQHMGRGVFTVIPDGERLRASFTWHGKEYTFRLPEAEKSGVAMKIDGKNIILTPAGMEQGVSYGLSVTCRGSLKHFQQVELPKTGSVTVSMPGLPTGVNNVTLFTDYGRIVADRLFFVNNNDCGGHTVTIDSGMKKQYAPYEKISISMTCRDMPNTFSVAIRDTRTDEPTYNDGNMMTDLLLGSELKGFVANPAYYFETADERHTKDLDLLMMVQGWRKYNWQELADTAYLNRRYSPEKTMTIEGCVYKMLSINEIELDEIENWKFGQGYGGTKTDDNAAEETADGGDDRGLVSTDEISTGNEGSDNGVIDFVNINDANSQLGVNHGNLRREVLVEAEVALENGFAASTQRTHNRGRFIFEIPPFYGTSILNMKAYSEKDSAQKNMTSRADKKILDENSYPDYFVKCDMIYPTSANPYSYYQDHAPDYVFAMPADTLSDLSMENEEHLLQNVNVKGKRRGKRAIDYSKPAFVADAYDLYNNITDYGLSFGKVDMRQFPQQICRFLFGNMNRYNRYNVAARMDEYTYYRNFKPDIENADNTWNNKSSGELKENLKLKRLKDIRVFTDFEPRNADSTMVTDEFSPDATVELVTFADNAVQPTFRDRHYILKGINEPAGFYNPDYSTQTPHTPSDYRRTLYWNPNARPDENGNFTATFYNNSKETRIKVSAEGIAPDGTIITTDPNYAK